MPIIQSFAESIVAWKKILAAFHANAEKLAPMAFLQEELEDLVERALELKSLQENQAAEKQETTKEIRQLMRAGQEAARRIRRAAQAALGSRSELLKAFLVMPLRDRKVRRGESDTPAPSEPTVPEAPPVE